MPNFVSFPADAPDTPVDHLVMNLVDPATDAGAVARLVSQSLEPQRGEAAALFHSDPLIDYRASRPWMNFKDGRLAGIWNDGIVLSHARDMEGKPFLHLHGQEPDFHWEALCDDMMEIAERFGVRRIFSLTAIGSATPHTRPADMLVRSTAPDPEKETLQADFWFQSSFADFVEYHIARTDLEMTNIAVRVPMYLAGHHYSAGALGALTMMASLSDLRLPFGDLEQDAAKQSEEFSVLMGNNEELAHIIQDYDESGVTPGFVKAPQSEFVVPSLDEIGRAAEQFLAQMDNPGPAYSFEHPRDKDHDKENKPKRRGKHSYPRDAQ